MSKAVALEAIKELHISDEPDLYRKLRRFARRVIKRQSVEPVDVINWPKGCLCVGLMTQALKLADAGNSPDRALSLYIFSEIKDYADRWIEKGMPVYKIDDCLFGQALLMLADFLKKNVDTAEGQPSAFEKYMMAADKIYEFLLLQDKDVNGSLPYRPAHGTGDIYADGVGMAAPFLIGYGRMRQNEDALELGIKQIRFFMDNGIDEQNGIPFHAYSLKNGLKQYAPGWGRAFGWLFYGVGASIGFLIGMEGRDRTDSFTELTVLNELKGISDRLSATAASVIRNDGLFGSSLTDAQSEADTSAGAMILYGMYEDLLLRGAACPFDKDKLSKSIDALKGHICEDGTVDGAQGECMGLGMYSENYGSYPWSVGMTLLVI